MAPSAHAEDRLNPRHDRTRAEIAGGALGLHGVFRFQPDDHWVMHGTPVTASMNFLVSHEKVPNSEGMGASPVA